MSRPRLLDLFCGAGGAARGYQLAGFEVVGVDVRPQPRYAGDRFLQADVMEVGLDALLRELGPLDAVHASPPCQWASRATAWRGRRADHVNLIPPTRDMLFAAGLPYIIENVQEARGHLRNPLLLCGSMFGIAVERHRYFETNWPVWQPASCAHVGLLAFDHGGTATESEYRAAMGCEWMTVHEARQAIPPAYTEWIGLRLTAILTANPVNPSEPVGTGGDNLPRHLTSTRTGGNPSEPVGTSAKLRSPSVAGPAQGPAEFAGANSNPPLPLSPELTAAPSGDSHSDSRGRPSEARE